MGTIETIFEGYKVIHGEETPQTEGQKNGLDAMNGIMNGADFKSMPEMHRLFDSAVEYARESEKDGFIAGFRMAVNMCRECDL